MGEPRAMGCRVTSSSASNTSSQVPSSAINMAGIFRALLACLTPSQASRNLAVFHNSVPIESMPEENKKLKFLKSIDDLPDLLLVDIIQRLPLDSVFRSKCVSKKWLSLISDPIFTCSYTSRWPSHTRPLALFYINSFVKSERPCDVGPYCPIFESESMDFSINAFKTKLQRRQRETLPLQLIGSDHDLLLYSGSSNTVQYSIYCVCNPLTFEWFTLPQVEGHRIQFPAVGFMVEEDYMFWVVEIIPHQSPYVLSFRVFHSGKGKWCIRKVLNTRPFDLFNGKKTVAYHGMILWMVDVGLLAFDPKDDGGKSRIIDLPNNELGKFGVSCGNLYFYEVSSHDPSQPVVSHILRVWALIDFEGGEWILKHSIAYGDLWSRDEHLNQYLVSPNTETYFHWVSLHPMNSDLMFLKCEGDLVSCKISSSHLESLPCDPGQAMFYRLEWDVLPLVLGP